MFCLIIGCITLLCGIFYIATGYEMLVGIVQIILGILSISLVILWKTTLKKKEKKQE